MTAILKPNGFAVRIASGSRPNQAAGFVPTAITRNIFTAAAERPGILLKPAAFVPVAITAGFGLRACAAPNGRGTKIGMKKRLTENAVNLFR